MSTSVSLADLPVLSEETFNDFRPDLGLRLRSGGHEEHSMKLSERYDLQKLGNRTEELVFDAIARLIEGGADVCTCEECVLDLAAWALNHVTPRYYTSLLAPLNPRPDAERRMHVGIELAIASGLERLRRHPHHTRSEVVDGRSGHA